jgi:ATP-dependent RNA helicase DDX46/PRP5
MVELGRRFLNKPLEITVDTTSKTAHLVEVLQEGDKLRRLLHALGRGKSIVYASTQKRTEELHQQLVSKGIRASVIHGGHEQQRRTAAINDLRSGRSTVLVATSVASRGLDIADLRLVVNFDAPDHKEDYVHRAGRVGRNKNAAGIVITFVSRDDPHSAHVVMEGMQQLHASIPPELAALCKKRKAKARGYGGRGYSFGDEERTERRRIQRASFGGEGGVEVEDDEMESTLEPSGSPGDSPTAEMPEGYDAARQSRNRARASPYGGPTLPDGLRRSLDGKPSIRR